MDKDGPLGGQEAEIREQLNQEDGKRESTDRKIKEQTVVLLTLKRE